MQKYLLASMLSLGCVFQPAQAGGMEELLATPAIQSLLGRLHELPGIRRNCADPTFRQRNAAFCQQADDAARLAQAPAELRSLMAQPKSAASLRELCTAVLGQPAQKTYLCAELAKADPEFNAIMERHRRSIENKAPEYSG